MAKKAPKASNVELLEFLLEEFERLAPTHQLSGICAIVWKSFPDYMETKEWERVIKMIKDCSPYKNEDFEDLKVSTRKGDHFYWMPMTWSNVTDHEIDIRRVFIKRMITYYTE